MPVTPNSIVTPQTPVFRVNVATTAEIAFAAPTNIVLLVDDTSNTNGIRLTSIYAIQRAATAANLNCQLYRKVGTSYALIDSVLMTTNTPSATVANVKADFGYSEDNALILEAGVGLSAAIGTTIGNGVVFVARGAAY